MAAVNVFAVFAGLSTRAQTGVVYYKQGPHAPPPQVGASVGVVSLVAVLASGLIFCLPEAQLQAMDSRVSGSGSPGCADVRNSCCLSARVSANRADGLALWDRRRSLFTPSCGARSRWC